MEILKIAILILLTVILSNGISFISKEFTVLITLLCCIVVLLYTLEIIVPAISYIKNIVKNINFIGSDIVLKSVGIGFITQFVSDIAADSNNKTLANQMVFAGRICILLLALPIFKEILKIIELLTL